MSSIPDAPRLATGRTVARILAGSWRPQPPTPEVSRGEWMAALPVLLSSGCGALAWRRAQATSVAGTAIDLMLRDAFDRYESQAVAQEDRIARVFAALREADCEPILFKGWSAARLYPRLGLRPPGDIDLSVGPERFDTALEVLREMGLGEFVVDLHRDGARLHGKSWDSIFAASRLVALGDAQVRIPSEEDHLRLCAQHLLRHGACRPTWLCDIGAALEAASDAFDADRCLAGDPALAGGVRCVVAAARELLGAELGEPTAALTTTLPSWFLPTLLSEWSREQRSPLPLHWSQGVRHLAREAWRRRPNKIEATARRGAAFDEGPRLPWQIAEAASRAWSALTR